MKEGIADSLERKFQKDTEEAEELFKLMFDAEDQQLAVATDESTRMAAEKSLTVPDYGGQAGDSGAAAVSSEAAAAEPGAV